MRTLTLFLLLAAPLNANTIRGSVTGASGEAEEDWVNRNSEKRSL
ncbi:MAG: hypothetical protein ACC661_06660 [Verrucomicrobiales bacterium]